MKESKCTECNYFKVCRRKSVMKGSALCDKNLGFMKKDKTNRKKKLRYLFR